MFQLASSWVALFLKAMIEFPMLNHGIGSLGEWPLLEEPGTGCVGVQDSAAASLLMLVLM